MNVATDGSSSTRARALVHRQRSPELSLSLSLDRDERRLWKLLERDLCCASLSPNTRIESRRSTSAARTSWTAPSGVRGISYLEFRKYFENGWRLFRERGRAMARTTKCVSCGISSECHQSSPIGLERSELYETRKFKSRYTSFGRRQQEADSGYHVAAHAPLDHRHALLALGGRLQNRGAGARGLGQRAGSERGVPFKTTPSRHFALRPVTQMTESETHTRTRSSQTRETDDGRAVRLEKSRAKRKEIKSSVSGLRGQRHQARRRAQLLGQDPHARRQVAHVGTLPHRPLRRHLPGHGQLGFGRAPAW